MSVVELPWGGMTLSAEAAASLALVEAGMREFWHGKGVGVPSLHEDVWAAARRQADLLRARRNGQGFAPRPAPVSPLPSPRFPATECERLTTGQVAERLGISEQRVRTLCRKDRLEAVRSGEGPGAHWLISEESVAAWETKRDARGRRRAA